MSRQRGAALLLVMWLVLLLSGLVAAYAMSARIESLQGNGAARGVVAGEAARAGVELAASRLLAQDPKQRWAADGRAYKVPFGRAEVAVAILDEAAKIDLNAAAPTLLAGLFEELGEPRERAARLAAAIADWRDPDNLSQPAGGAEDPAYAAAGLAWGAKDAAFDSVAELFQILGMRPALVAAALPHLTVYSNNATPDANIASPVVLAAMGLQPRTAPIDPDAPPASAGSGTYSIDSRARLPDGRSAHLSVVLRMGGNALPGSTYTPLRWQAGSDPR